MRCWTTAKPAFNPIVVRRPWVAALAGALALVSPAWTAPPRTLRDATGAQVRLVARPARIVTLAPSLAELAAELIGPAGYSRISGVSEYTDYPAELAGKSSIGPYYKFNIERVAALKPDLVLATHDGNNADQVLRLRELGLPVVVVATGDFAEVEHSMRLVGEAVGEPGAADALARDFAAGLMAVRARKHATSPRVLLQLGDDPLVVVGRQSFLHDALVAVGGRNAYGDATARYPRPATEDVLKRDPDRIIVLALGHDLAIFNRMAEHWNSYPRLAAVKSKRVSVLQGDAILRPSRRLLVGLADLERVIHGEAAK